MKINMDLFETLADMTRPEPQKQRFPYQKIYEEIQCLCEEKAYRDEDIRVIEFEHDIWEVSAHVDVTVISDKGTRDTPPYYEVRVLVQELWIDGNLIEVNVRI